jgi:uncharacterized Zn finger protein
MEIQMYCPKCLGGEKGEEITKEKRGDVDYPYECTNCDQNFYEFELVKEINGVEVRNTIEIN